MVVKTVPIAVITEPHYCVQSHQPLLDEITKKIGERDVIQTQATHELYGGTLVASGKERLAEGLFYVTETRYGHTLNTVVAKRS